MLLIEGLKLKQLIRLMKDASLNTLKYYKSCLDIETKVDNTPVTIADRTTNEMICQTLNELFPDIPIISEESSVLDYQIRKNYTWVWLVDPLDGTREFIKGGRDYTVNIGLIYLGEPLLGLVSVPVEEKTYLGIVNSSKLNVDITGLGKLDHYSDNGIAWEIKFNQTITPIYKLLVQNSNNRKLKVVASKSHLSKETSDFIEFYLKGSELINIGSSLKIIWVALGIADCYPRLGLTSEWDTAAAHAILKSVGGEIYNLVNMNCLKEFEYNKENILNGWFIAGNNDLLFNYLSLELIC